MYAVLADLTMLVHFAFIAFVVLGGFLAWRWPWVLAAHVPTIAWAGWGVLFHLTCPLTPVEDHFRSLAGQERLGADGFIATYLTGVIYPEESLRLVQAGVAIVVAISWAGFVARRRRVRERERASG